MHTVDIITRTKNRPLFLRRAFESINAQRFTKFTWVIVNDGGNVDEVNRVVKLARERSLDVNVFHNKTSRGMEAASNIGIQGSKSDFIIIHDDDDTWEQDFLKKTVSFLSSSEGERYGGVITHTAKIEEKINEQGECSTLSRSPFNDWLYGVYLSDVARLNPFPPISFLYRRKIYAKLGGYDERLPVLGDWLFNLNFLMSADIAVIPELLANYHQRVSVTNETASYGNTVTQGINKHKEYDAILRNELLRRDLSSNTVGLGFLVNYYNDRQGHDTFLSLYNLKRALAETSLGRFAKKFMK